MDDENRNGSAFGASREDENLRVEGLSVADVDAGAALLTVTAGALHGGVTLDGTFPASGLADGLASYRNASYTGTLADVNVRLAHLVYRGDRNWHGVDDLTLTVVDAVGHPDGPGAGDGHTTTRTVLVDVAAVNDPPAINVEGTTGRHDM